MISNDRITPFQSKMSLAEIMTIIIYWNQSGYKNFKSFYTKELLVHLKSEFPNARQVFDHSHANKVVP